MPGVVAKAVRDAKGRLPKNTKVGVLAAGYVTNKMTALDYAESDLPLHILVDDAAQQQVENFARTLIASADTIAADMRKALRQALEAGFDSSLTAAASTRFWARTEVRFRGLLDAAAGHGANEAGDRARLGLRTSWRDTLEREALAAFDSIVPLDTLGDLKTDRREAIIRARKNLLWTLRGYGKGGAKFFSELGAAAPPAKETINV
jgi:CRISPR system Cascade subunit CasA